jgi:phosphatidylglycerol:prolipoprotein diacylglycerol transferase
MQETFGIPVPPGTEPSTVMAVHPTQLYEAALMLGAFALLWRLRKAGKPIGWIFGIYLVLAGVERFLIEFVRAKDDRFFGPLTVAQVTSLALVLLGTLMLAIWRQGPSLDPGPYLEKKPA